MCNQIGILDSKPVQATRHAVKRFMERHLDSECVWWPSWDYVLECMEDEFRSTTPTVPVNYEQRAQNHRNKPSYRYHEDLDLRFVLVDSGSHWTVVTVERPYES